jgi:hypothetical protein
MAFFEGGKIPVIGVTPQFLGNTIGQGLTQITQAQISNVVGQAFQGSGNSFLGGAGQTIVSNTATNALMFGLSSVLGEEIAGQSGLNLTNGQDFLASVITPSIGPLLSAGINQTISNSLESAGPFGPVLSSIGSSLVSTTVSNLFGGNRGGVTLGEGGGLPAGPSRRFPGASSNDPEADYSGGGAYTLGPLGPDVVFSLQPANQGPQLFGELEGLDSKSFTSFSAKDFSTTPPNFTASNYDTTQSFKFTSMEFSQIDGAYDPGELQKYWNPDAKVDTPSFQNPNLWTRKPGWTFICAPEDISWDLANASTRIDIFGTNNPPVVAGTKGMRDLSISNALVEGFSRGVTIEGKIRALENLMKYGANATDGFVSVPVYQFWANKKGYGSSETEGGYFIIKDVRVKEELRDLKGDATRARVDISLVQVPAYQVNSGRDQASKVTTGAKSKLVDQAQANAQQTSGSKTVKEQANQKKPGGGPSKPANPSAATGQKKGTLPRNLSAQPLPLTLEVLGKTSGTP